MNTFKFVTNSNSSIRRIQKGKIRKFYSGCFRWMIIFYVVLIHGSSSQMYTDKSYFTSFSNNCSTALERGRTLPTMKERPQNANASSTRLYCIVKFTFHYMFHKFFLVLRLMNVRNLKKKYTRLDFPYSERIPISGNMTARFTTKIINYATTSACIVKYYVFTKFVFIGYKFEKTITC